MTSIPSSQHIHTPVAVYSLSNVGGQPWNGHIVKTELSQAGDGRDCLRGSVHV